MRVLSWLVDQILRPNCSITSLTEYIDPTLLFSEPNVTLTSDLRDAMDVLCRFEGVTT